jgi:antitoxin component YwqK of YwqJK toxin-antitoxin module
MYYDNGKLKFEGGAKDGKRDGEYKLYDETGRLIKYALFKEGDLIQEYHPPFIQQP